MADDDAPANPAAPWGTRKNGTPRLKPGVRKKSVRMPKPQPYRDPVPEMEGIKWGAGLPRDQDAFAGWKDVPREEWPKKLPPSTLNTVVIAAPDVGAGGQLTRASAAAILRPYGPEILRTYIEIMRNAASSDSDRLRAADSLSNRLWGKPTEHVEISESPSTQLARDVLAGYSPEELRAYIASAIGRKDEIDVTPDPAAP